jgi:hypothetical protein
MNKNKIVLISLVLFDCGGIGHNYEYVNAVYNSTEKIGWTHYAALPANFLATNLKKTWTACLSNCRRLSDKKENLFIKTFRLTLNSLKLSKSIYQYLDNILSTIDKESLPIIFIDSFKPPEILAFTIALFFLPYKKLTVWLFYRHDDYQKKLIGKFYKIINIVIKNKITVNKFILLTDSKKLQKSLNSYFKQQIHLLPIPHTQNLKNIIKDEIIKNTTDTSISAWWCGNPNLEKGLKTIQELLTLSDPFAKYIHLFTSKSAYLPNINNNITITYLPAYLTRQEYLQQLNNVDILLLPYDSEIYRERTSGVFVEAICAGKIPFVTQGTWMATELIPYNLNELIIDWTKNNVFESMFTIANTTITRKKIMIMRDDYLKFHSVESYARQMQQIFDLSAD